jgi:phosphate transport system substrate-binding protein
MMLRIWSMLAIAMLGSYAPGQELTSIPVYVPAHRVAGVIRSWGSPEMSGLMRTWQRGFRRFHPGVEFEDSLKGTASAVAGIYSGRADLALLGRDIWPSEIAAFHSIYGYNPVSVEAATGSFDIPKATYALMVFVSKDNPLQELSLVKLETIFGNDRGSTTCGAQAWGELGLTGEWANKPIDLYGFDLDNDKALAFSRIVFKRTRRWNCRIQEFSNSTSGDAGQLIMNALAKDQYGIAISNVHYSTPGVKVLALGLRDGGPFVMPTKESVQSRIYPLVRSTHIVVNRNPSHPVDPKVLEFLRYVLSRQGQEDVLNEKTYLPLTDKIVRSERNRLQAQPGAAQTIHR